MPYSLGELQVGRGRYGDADVLGYLKQVQGALNGDLVLSVTPATLGSSAAAVNAAIGGAEGKFTRDVVVKLVDANGAVHTWANAELFAVMATATGITGGAALAGGITQVALVNGEATVTVEYTGTWAAGDTCTVTVTGGTLLGFAVANKTSVDTLVA